MLAYNCLSQTVSDCCRAMLASSSLFVRLLALSMRVACPPPGDALLTCVLLSVAF